MCINLYNVHLYSVKLLKLMVLTVSIEELHVFLVYVADFSLEFHTENKHRFFLYYTLYQPETLISSLEQNARGLMLVEG